MSDAMTYGEIRRLTAALTRLREGVAQAMSCENEDDDDLVEAVRLLVTERDQAKEQARLGRMVASRMQAERDEALALDCSVQHDADAARIAALERERDEARMVIRGLESKIADYERRSEANAEIANQARAAAANEREVANEHLAQRHDAERERDEARAELQRLRELLDGYSTGEG